MNESHKNLIKERYDNAVHEYCHAYCLKHGLTYNPDGWSAGVIGGVLLVGKKYVGFLQIKDDIDNEIPSAVQDCLATQTDEMNFIEKGGKA